MRNGDLGMSVSICMSCEWARRGSSPISKQSCMFTSEIEVDQFKVNMGEKKSITNIDIEMYLTLLGNI